MPLLTFPFALAAMTALPALAAIYWLRNKHRQMTVSSLMLFDDHQRPREGGVKLQRSGLPWMFFLELLILALLVLAATDPQLRLSREERPLVVILDDSYCMLAGTPTDSPRVRAEGELFSILAANSGEPTRLILAGPQPQALGELFRASSDARPLMKSWTCLGASSDMPRALAMARELGGVSARILVLTDAPPPEDQKEMDDHLRWISTGKKQGNLAIVNATRTVFESQHRVLLEIANHSDVAIATPLRMEFSGLANQPAASSVSLGAHELKRMIFEIPATPSTLSISLPEDGLNVDNAVVLPPPPERSVRVAVMVSDPFLRLLVNDALDSTGLVKKVEAGAQLVISDGVETNEVNDAWTVRLIAAQKTQAYLGPFIMDRTHPLTQGLSLQGVVWSAEAVATTQPATQPMNFEGVSVISAGNIPLINDSQRPMGEHDVTIHFKASLSTLQQDPAWAVLMWNLVQWRASAMPGPQRAVVRLGESVNIALPRGATTAVVTDPLGVSRTLRATSRSVTISADAVGRYRIAAGSENFSIDCATLNGDTSDLSHKSPGQWGKWVEKGQVQSAYRTVGWVIALLALLALAGHAWLGQNGSEHA